MLAIVLVTTVIGFFAGTVGLVAWGRREPSQRRSLRVVKRVTIGLAAVIVGVVGLVVGMVLWALTATDSSVLARAIVWQESDTGDIDRFPARSFSAAAEPVVFPHLPDPLVAEIRVDPGQVPLDEYLEAAETYAFLVLRGDDLIYEGYFNGAAREDLHTSFSVAKSFTATLVGIALGEGHFSGLDDPITDYLPELAERDPRFGDITLRHLITMSAGMRFEEWLSAWDDPTLSYYATDLRAAVLEHTEIEDPPGTVFHYNDYYPPLLGMALERAAGMPVSEFMETRLWRPMGAEYDGSWSLDGDDSGFEKMFVGVNAAAVDYAKLGWLYLNGGRNGDRQVVPETWVDEATRLDVTTDPAPEYQYYWWIDEERDAYYAQGDKCQFIYVYPSADMVLVRLGRDCGGIYWTGLMGDIAGYLEGRFAEG
jgi:CubicO group peptidase (beta-lactamase class C family)